jgi:DNA-binding HxlR family transcriptional regulator
MSDRLVADSVQIFSLLLKGKTNVNSVIERTGLYKDYVHEDLTALKKAGLIARTRTKKHSQMIVNELTPLGFEIASLKSSIEAFNEAYFKLIKLIVENLDFDSAIETKADNTLGFIEDIQPKEPSHDVKSVLLGRNWKLDEVPRYYNWAIASKDFALASIHTFILALCTRYIYFLFSEDVVTNELAKDILSKIFTDGIKGCQQFTDNKSYLWFMESIKSPWAIAKTDFRRAGKRNTLGALYQPVISYLNNYSLEKNNSLNNRFVGAQASEVMNYISSINPSFMRKKSNRK